MSTDFKLEKKVSFKELLDGRLEPFGIREEYMDKSTSSNVRALTDGRNYLWICGDENVKILTRFGRNSPDYILEVIARTFDTGVWSEYEPQFWGFETQEEMDAHEIAAAEHSRRVRYEKLMKMARGGNVDPTEHEYLVATGEIAKELIEEQPYLTDPDRMDEFLEKVDNRYVKEKQSSPETEVGLLRALLGDLQGEGEPISDDLSEMFEEIEHKSHLERTNIAEKEERELSRDKWLEHKAREIMERTGCDIDLARCAAQVVGNTFTLADDYTLHFEHFGRVTVAEVLSNPTRFDQAAFDDPLAKDIDNYELQFDWNNGNPRIQGLFNEKSFCGFQEEQIKKSRLLHGINIAGEEEGFDFTPEALRAAGDILLAERVVTAEITAIFVERPTDGLIECEVKHLESIQFGAHTTEFLSINRP